MEYQVLAIGYELIEQKETYQQWNKHGINLEYVSSAQQAKLLIKQNNYTCVIFHSRILDSLPYIDIMRDIKSIPILIVTPGCTNIEQWFAVEFLLKKDVQGFGGANIQPCTFTYGDLHFCLEQRTVSVCGQEVLLTAKEFDILALLICNPCRVFTFEMIMELVWDGESDFYSRKAIINHVSNLRKKLKVTDAVPDYIKSVRGIGYKFDKN